MESIQINHPEKFDSEIKILPLNKWLNVMFERAKENYKIKSEIVQNSILTISEEFVESINKGNLHPFLTIDENFYLKDIFSGKRFKAQTLDSKITEQLKRFDIVHRMDSYPLEISGGELQRASLAIANNDFPPIVVLDEPTANLDSELAEQAMNQIYELHGKTGITFLIATHDINLIRDGIRAIELVDGRINKDGLVVSKNNNKNK